MVTGSKDVDEIYHRMAVIRREPHTNVREAVAGAEAVMDWGRYTWTYPWIALGGAVVAGYLLYATAPQKAAPQGDGPRAGEPVEGVTPQAKAQARSSISRNLLVAAWDMLFPVAVRAGQNSLLRWLEQQYPTQPVEPTTPSRPVGERSGWAGRAER